ncbi:MAG: hypothetical protein WCC64_04675 [Aliidongia sp.]
MDSNSAITYVIEPHMSAAEFIDVLRRSSLAARRPVMTQIASPACWPRPTSR